MPVPVHLRRYLISWPLPREGEQKSFFETTHRVVSPEETFARIAPLRERAGITRLADITGLDCLGIPTYVAVRPMVDCYDANISVYNGKGLTEIQAKVSALMEAFESYAAERHRRPTVTENLKGMERYGIAVDPGKLHLPPGESYDADEPLEWVCGTNLASGETCFVPAIAAFYPYAPTNGGRSFNGFSDSNGLASGNTLSEAISHALAEVIERDASTMAELSRSATTIDLNSIDSPLIQSLLEKYRRAGMKIVIKEITSEFGIPTFFAVTDDPVTENPMLLCGGFGTHVNAEIAVMRAITEAAQSRCTVISGSREDLTRDEYKLSLSYKELKEKLSYWYLETPPLKNFRDMKILTHHQISDDIRTMVQGLQDHKYDEVIAVNLTSDDIPIPVVRVIVPGLEAPMESKRRGRRALQYAQ